MADRPDVELLFGVKGGGDISKDSGKLIKQQLESVISQIETQLPKIKLDVELNEKGLVAQIQKAFKGVKIDTPTFTQPKNIKNIAKSTSTNKTNIDTDTKSIEKQIKKISELKMVIDGLGEKQALNRLKPLKKYLENVNLDNIEDNILKKQIEDEKQFLTNKEKAITKQKEENEELQKTTKLLDQIEQIRKENNNSVPFTSLNKATKLYTDLEKINTKDEKYNKIKDDINNEKNFLSPYVKYKNLLQQIIDLRKNLLSYKGFNGGGNLLSDTIDDDFKKKIDDLKTQAVNLDFTDNATQEEIANTRILEEKLNSVIVSYGQLSDASATFLKNSTAHSKDTIIAFEKLNEEIEKGVRTTKLDENGNDTKIPLGLAGQIKAYEEAIQQVSRLYREADAIYAKTGDYKETPFDKLIKSISNHFYAGLAAAVTGFGARAFKQIYTNVLEIDKAMTDLRIVTNETAKSYENFSKSIAKSAKEIGASVSDLINSTTTYARLGYSLGDSEIFAKLTAMYSNVTGIDVSTATTNITAVVKAYGLAADELESVLDKMITVGNNFAISSGELGEALNNAASILQANGNSLEESLGILAAANATLQNVSKSSTAVRTITARISASTGELEELGEDVSTVIATADLAEQMSAYGVSILKANGELRSTYDILNDLSKMWDKFNNTEQAAIANLLAGSRQQTAFYSIMNNWQDAVKSVELAGNSSGTLTEAYDEYLDSIQGKLGQLQAIWQSFSQQVLDSELVKSFIDVLKGIATVIDFVANSFDGFGANIVVTIGIIGALSIAIEALKGKIIIAFNNIGKTFKTTFTTAGTYIPIVISLLLSLSKSSQSWTKGTAVALSIVGISISVLGLIISKAIKETDNAFKKFMASNPIGWVMLGITALITLIKSATDLWKKNHPTFDDLKDSAKDAQKELVDITSELQEINDELQTVKERIEELEKKDPLTIVEENELAKLKQEQAILESMAKLKKQEEKEKAQEALSKTQTALDAYNKKLQGKNIDYETKVNKGDEIGGITGALPGLATGAAAGFLMGGPIGAILGALIVSSFTAAIGAGIGEAIASSGDKTTELDYYNANLKALKEINDKLQNESNKLTAEEIKSLQESKDKITSEIKNYLNTIEETISDFEYQYPEFDEDGKIISDLEDWQKDVNAILDDYYDMLTKFNVANDDIDLAWESLLNRAKYSEAVNKLKDLSNNLEVTEENINELYNSTDDDSVKEFIDKLEELGIVVKKDGAYTEEFVEQIKHLNTNLGATNAKDYFDILDKLQDKYDSITNALKDMQKYGIVTANTIASLKEKFPEIFNEEYGVINLTPDGYTINQNALDVFYEKQKEVYQNIIDKLNEDYNTAFDNYGENDSITKDLLEQLETAKENLENFEVVMQSLQRTDLLEKYTERLEKQSDALEDQLSKYKDIVDMRKDLLKTYKEEVDYQKNLASKTKTVNDLQTQLALAQLDTSASGQARARELQEELNKAQEDLEEFTLENAIDKISDKLDDTYDEYEKFIQEQVDSIKEAIENAAKLSNAELKENTTENSSSIINNPIDEEDARSLAMIGMTQAELTQMLDEAMVEASAYVSNYFGSLFTNMVERDSERIRNQMKSVSNNTVTFNSPLVEIHCDSISQDSLPRFEEIVDTAVKKVKDEIDNKFSRSGLRNRVDKFRV